MPLALRIALILFAAAAAWPPARADRQSIRPVAPGVELVQVTLPGPVVVTALRVDPRVPGVRVAASVGDGIYADTPSRGRETPAEVAARETAVAAVNADFFPFTGDPLGLTIRDGELLSESEPRRAAFGVSEAGAALLGRVLTKANVTVGGERLGVAGINRAPAADEIVVVTPSAGSPIAVKPTHTVVTVTGVVLPVRPGVTITGATAEPAPAPPALAVPGGTVALVGDGTGGAWLREHCRPGAVVGLRFDLEAIERPAAGRAADWNTVRAAVGGGSWVVRAGKEYIDAVEAGFGLAGFVNARHPRTAVGVSASGSLLLVVVDGRQPHSRGASLAELARIMLDLGSVDAINLDGGGSSAIAAAGVYVTGPSDGSPRPVASSLVVHAEGPPSGSPEAITAREVVAGALAALDEVLPRGTAPALWGTLEGRGFVDQDGRVSTTRAGAFTVVARANGRSIHVPLTVRPGPPAALRAALGPVANDPPDRSALTVAVTDRFGNAVPDAPVRVRASGGTTEAAEVRTDSRGKAAVEVVWDEPGKGSVEASCAGVPPARVQNRPPAAPKPM